jgi:hypothetical protein
MNLFTAPFRGAAASPLRTSLRPPLRASRAPSASYGFRFARGRLIQNPPYRRRDRSKQGGLTAQRVDVGDRLPPTTSVVVTSTHTRPRSCTGTNPRRVSAADSPSASPTPQPHRDGIPSGTTPVPCPVADDPLRPRSKLHLRSAFQTRRIELSASPILPLPARHFRRTKTHVSRSGVNGPG